MEQASPRTQKARGVMWLQDNAYQLQGALCGKINYHAVYDARTVSPDELTHRFCRPCPMRPRHGFVDSRYISNPIEAQKMIAETLAADPDAEILTANPVAAEYSAVWTKGLFAIGKGTDGATAGTSSRTIPVTGELLAGLDYSSVISHAPYAELLYKNSKPFIVQLRDGEPVPDSADWIPYIVTVARVVKAQGDLLEWEALCQILKGTIGTVVDHSDGGSLASHYAQHCVLNNIPIITSHAPQVGETLSANSETPKIDIRKLRSGFVAAQRLPMDYSEAAQVMLSGCHHIAKWAGREDFLLGVAMGAAYRLTVIASLGEVRHVNVRKNKIGRESVYHRAWNEADSSGTRRRFAKAISVFGDYKRWEERFGPKHNYGGAAWENFAMLAVNMYRALIEEHSEAALQDFNLLVNAAHNSGWAFDKFVHKNIMDLAAANPVQAVVSCAPRLYESYSYAGTTWKRRVIHIPAPPTHPIAKPKPNAQYTPDNTPVVAAQIFVEGSKGHVQYKVATDTGDLYHSLNVVLSDNVEKFWPHDTKDSQSFAASPKMYHKLKKISNDWYYHSQRIFRGKGIR